MFDRLRNKIHILQNIYLKNKHFLNRKSYAMDGEDLAIDLFNKKRDKGFYVDIGAHHPIQRNNTHLLFKKGWGGINIDINQFSIELFNFLRPNDLNLQIAVSDKEGEVSFFYQKKFSQLNTTDKGVAKENFQGNFQEKKVKCKTIQNILDNSKYKNKKIDFLNIDIEGAEMKVLNTLNFEIYDPSLICIEILGYRDLNSEQREKEIKNNEIYKFLVNQGYKKVWSGSSYCSHLFTK
ncbi:FkbM family methyltransferase [Candidatus Pelagibacter bacterium]|nr:FkbM family methyltransferase [Candidatus Pelagibacter bacterium]